MKQQRTILIVDPCDADREMNRLTLLADTEVDYTVLEAASTAEGLALCRSQCPDGVLVEFQFPDSNGLDYLTQMKTEMGEACPVVVMLTGYGNEAIAVRAIKGGAENYLSKVQTTPEDLQFAIKSAIESGQTKRTLPPTPDFSQDQLDCKRAEEVLQTQALVLESMGEGVVMVDEAYLIIFTNPAFDRMFGYERHELLGQPISVLKTASPQASYLSDQVIETAKAQGSWSGELTYRRKNGSILITRVRVSTLEVAEKIYLIAVQEDITERKQAEEILRQSEAHYRYLAESIPAIVWTADPQGRIDYVNQKLQDYTGLSLEQVGGWSWLSVVHPDDVPQVQQWMDAKAKSLHQGEYRLKCVSDHTYRWNLIRCIPLKDEQGNVIKWFGTCTDIHEQKQIQEERARLLEQEQMARELAENASRSKDEFLAIVSHELRSPLNSIFGWSKLLRTRNLDEATTTRALEVIERNAQAQSQLIEDLLDISRMIRGNLRLTAIPVNLSAVVEAAIDVLRPATEEKQIHLQFSQKLGSKNQKASAGKGEWKTDETSIGSTFSTAHLPMLVLGDFNRLQQIVWNLLANAIKFTPSQGQVEVRLETVQEPDLDLVSVPKQTAASPEPSALRPSVYAQLQVIDTGKGISADFLPHVFDRFRQADSTMTKSDSGLGLGLAIVHHLVELHGGTVQVASPGEGLGTTFTVRLPLFEDVDRFPKVNAIAPEETATVSLDESSPAADPAPLTDVLVLLVDDEIDTREFLTFALEEAGAFVLRAASAQEAVELFEQFHPNILISDIAMPERDGYMLIQQLRTAAEPRAMIPAIALTARARAEDRDMALAAGFQRHIAKPVEPADLISAIAAMTR